LSALAECSFSKGRGHRQTLHGARRFLGESSSVVKKTGSSSRSSRLQENFLVTKAQSSKAEYEGDLSSSLLFQLSDSELENLASEYEYDIQSNKRKAKDGSPDYEDEEAEVDVHYEGISNEQAEEESRSFALSLAEALDEVKVQDITLLHVGPCVSWCTYFVVASVFSRPQLDAALNRVAKAAQEKHGRTSLNTERPGRTEWECIDYGDVVVHIMTPRQREKYDLEGYYSKAKPIDYQELAGRV